MTGRGRIFFLFFFFKEKVNASDVYLGRRRRDAGTYPCVCVHADAATPFERRKREEKKEGRGKFIYINICLWEWECVHKREW